MLIWAVQNNCTAFFLNKTMAQSEGLSRRYMRRLMTSFFSKDIEEAHQQEMLINKQVEKLKEMKGKG
jgi:hypothetical protein